MRSHRTKKLVWWLFSLLLVTTKVEQGFLDNFEKEILGLTWTHIRNPQMDNYMCTSSGIELIGEGIKLSDSLISPTFIGIRQTEYVAEQSIVTSHIK